ncbi:MAG: NADP transhydrogenase subunit alpha [Acidobacteria bacterium RIFCSPLOWO2_02_FULL_68_18]|nr:MAG: NADP transhydrogenase subunit alpha [Acidobacteria bacterium RIFCSPLOWO2_02_FULL_68_18]OFW50914.1 MAG: NADP transhydrogenase subunit alpha [Acidobacteria bacterium RIFCSPLOWO2_12_FULL_68_19]
MRIGVPGEIRTGETRVAATPETVRKLIQSGHHTCLVQASAGTAAAIPDAEFEAAGADVTARAADVYAQTDIVLKVRSPEPVELPMLRRGSVLVGLLNPHDEDAIEKLAETGVTAFAMEALPRITRAQTMDVLSSQANVAGYKAVLLAANEYRRFMPMLMTAAGTVKAARVLVLGAGVAGLQAIATARRLGAVVEAFDVRPAVKEQVESLGARFVEVPVPESERAAAETSGGYAREMSDDYRRQQAALIDERARLADIVITTALVPGRAAPILVREDTVRQMRPGSVVVDLAVEQGGNCALTERDRTVVAHGVRIVGCSNLPALVAADASALYARNLLSFVNLLVDPKAGTLTLDRSDEIIAATLVCIDGAPTRRRERSLA